MTYSNTPIQSVYNRYYDDGMPGLRANADNGVFFSDQANVQDGLTIYPGQGVYLEDDGNGNHVWVLPTDAATALLVTHVMGYRVTNENNTAVSSSTDNNTSRIAYIGGENSGVEVEAWAMGSMYVTFGETIVRGAALKFSDDGATVINRGASTNFALMMVALRNGTSGTVRQIRINRVY